MRIRAKRYDDETAVDVVIDASDRIASIGPCSATERPDLTADWIAPALFDLQINGCHGISFNSGDLTIEQVRRVIDVCRDHGIAELLPTLVTNSFESLRHGFSVLSAARAQDSVVAESVPGFHLEGPYISPEDGPRGAHPKTHVRSPDWDEFQRLQQAADGGIRLVTLAPELPGAVPFIERAVASGVVVAIGHTAANGVQLDAAVRAGARLSTHLGNGSHAVLPRHDNYIWQQLADDRLTASFIPDGFHLPDSVVKCIVRVKTADRAIVTCDAGSLAGMPPGRYRQWDTDLEVLPGGKVIVAGTPYLAGSGVFTDECVRRLVQTSIASLRDAVDMASARPRQLLGLPEWRLAVGGPARLMTIDRDAESGYRLRRCDTRLRKAPA